MQGFYNKFHFISMVVNTAEFPKRIIGINLENVFENLFVFCTKSFMFVKNGYKCDDFYHLQEATSYLLNGNKDITA